MFVRVTPSGVWIRLEKIDEVKVSLFVRVTPKVGVVGLNVFTLKYLLHTLFSLAFLEGVVKIGLETSCLKLFIHNISFLTIISI